jgi:hypothetical protein
VRQLLNIRDLKAFQTFIELLAARVGSLLNLNEISKECGITSGTAKSWVSLLESTRIILLLRPYAKNISKRVIKSPKIYFTDTGLLLYILRYMTGEMVLNSPLSGNIFENFLIIEFFKHKLNHQYMYEMYYYRDSNHNEIDLVLEFADHTKLCEIKIARTLNKNFISTIKNQLALFTNPTGYLLSFAEQSLKMDERIYAKPWSAIFKELIET